MPKTVKNSEEKVEEMVGSAAKKAKETAKKASSKVTGSSKTERAVRKADSLTAEAKKSVVRTTKKSIKEEVYLQYFGKEINKDDIVRQVKEIWTQEYKRKISEINTLTLYLKPEESRAYYVINGEVSGGINL